MPVDRRNDPGRPYTKTGFVIPASPANPVVVADHVAILYSCIKAKSAGKSEAESETDSWSPRKTFAGCFGINQITREMRVEIGRVGRFGIM